jgi:hypothetical protein
MFYLVRYTTSTIGWVKAPLELGQSWFDKYEPRIYQNLMADFDHEHIFTVMLMSQGQFHLIWISIILKFNQFDLTFFFSKNENIFVLIIKLFPRIRRILTLLSMTLQWTTNLTWYQSQWLMITDIFSGRDIMLYFQLMSQMSIDPSSDTSNTQNEHPCA